MATAAELTVEEELKPLLQIAEQRNWRLEVISPLAFAIQLPAKDGMLYWILVECDGYPATPPGLSWYEFESGNRNVPAATPKGNDFIHSSGRICAPWNRFAYQKCDPQGPHSDWELANWKSNPHTKGTKDLCAMILRMFVQLNSEHYFEPSVPRK